MVYVAEGTYGCVYRPPIKCKNGKKYTRGKISKLMTHRAANKEVKEYEFIKKVDKVPKNEIERAIRIKNEYFNNK